MPIRAYPEHYLQGAMQNMAVMLDYAVNSCGRPVNYFFKDFIDHGFALQFERGNPDVLIGKTGIELYQMITADYFTHPYYASAFRTPEYWLGWSLAYYQWFTCVPFIEIVATVRPSDMLVWYPTLHEADLSRFVETLDKCIQDCPTALANFRRRAGLSQTELAALSGVDVRTIQSYEQRKSNIANAQFNILHALAQVLGCGEYELIREDLDAKRTWYFTDRESFSNQLRTACMRADQQSMYLQPYGSFPVQMQSTSLRNGYLAQFPYQTLQYQSDAYYINKEKFAKNWSNYWQQSLNNISVTGQPAADARKLIQETVWEALGQAVRKSGDKKSEAAYEALSAVKADNIVEAACHVANFLAAIQQGTVSTPYLGNNI